MSPQAHPKPAQAKLLFPNQEAAFIKGSVFRAPKSTVLVGIEKPTKPRAMDVYSGSFRNGKVMAPKKLSVTTLPMRSLGRSGAFGTGEVAARGRGAAGRVCCLGARGVPRVKGVGAMKPAFRELSFNFKNTQK